MNIGVIDKSSHRGKVAFFVTEDWYFHSHRFDFARHLLDCGYRVAIGTRLNQHRRTFEDAGLEVFDVPFARSFRAPLNDIRSIKAIRHCCAMFDPDIVHLVSLKPILVGGLALSGHPHVKLLYAFTGLGHLFTAPGLLARGMRTALVPLMRAISARDNAWVLVQNRDDEEELERRKISHHRRVVLVPGVGIDQSRFAFAPPPQAPPYRVLLPARLLVDKGINEFAAAARSFRKRRQDVEFVLAGRLDPDNPSAISAATVESWEREGILSWIGWRADIEREYRDAAIVCLPSYREGLPKALLEGAACGRPLVATDVPGCREVCLDGVTGLSVRPRCVEDLVAAIETLIDDPVLLAECGRRAKQMIDQKFSIERINQQTIAVYKKLASTNRGHQQS